MWTLGLLGLVHVLVLAMLRQVPALLRVNHHVIGAVGLVLMLGGVLALRSGLKPLAELRVRLGGLRAGQARRVEGRYPDEIQPLVNDLNTLLENRERAVARALTTAGDLAHGLKTPLAVLTQEAERATAAGQVEIAGAIEQQVERMRRQVEYQLARARAAGRAPGACCRVAESVEGLIRTLGRLHAELGLSIEARVAEDQEVAAQREDLDEMLGNLLENACKWAKGRIVVEAFEERDVVVMTVNDDGPGLAPLYREKVLQRGVRADEAAQGSGLGLAIVRDLAELYGGRITLGASGMGGLQARLELPGCVLGGQR